MNMGFTERCRYWFVTQAVVIILCYRGNASSSRASNIAQSCVGSRLQLTCPPTKVIRIESIYLGLASCEKATCCIKDAGCPQTLSDHHVKFVHETCNDQQNCTMDIQSFEKQPCTSGWWLLVKTKDGQVYEKITYICNDGPDRSTSARPSRTDAADEKISYRPTTEKFPEVETTTDNVTSTDVTPPTNLYNNTEATVGKTAEALSVVMVITCLVILVATVVLVIMYQRKKCTKLRLSHPVAMTEVGNRQNETDIYTNDSQGISQHENNDPLSLYKLAEDDLTVYSEVGQRKLGWKEGKSVPHPATDKTKAAVEPRIAGPDVYAVVNKPSKTQATSSALKKDRVGGKGLVNKGTCLPDQIYSLASNDTADTYANVSSTRLLAEAVAKTSLPQDDGGQTVIENDLYCH